MISVCETRLLLFLSVSLTELESLRKILLRCFSGKQANLLYNGRGADWPSVIDVWVVGEWAGGEEEEGFITSFHTSQGRPISGEFRRYPWQGGNSLDLFDTFILSVMLYWWTERERERGLFCCLCGWQFGGMCFMWHWNQPASLFTIMYSSFLF